MSVRVCSPDLRTAPQGTVFWTELVQRNIAARLLRTPYREVDCKWLRPLSTERKGRSIQLGELVGKKCRCGVLLPFVHPEGSCPRITDDGVCLQPSSGGAPHPRSRRSRLELPPRPRAARVCCQEPVGLCPPETQRSATN